MVMETEQDGVLSALAPEPDVSATTDVEPLAEESPGAEPEEAPESEAVQTTWEEWKAQQIDGNEEWATHFKNEMATAYDEGRTAERDLVPEYQQSIQLSREVQGQLRKANTVGEQLIEALNNVVASRDPDLVEAVERVLSRDAKVADSIRLLGQSRDADSTVRFFQSQSRQLAQLGIGNVDDKGNYQLDPTQLPAQIAGRLYYLARSTVDLMAKEAGLPSILRDFDSAMKTPDGSDPMVGAIKAFAEHFKKQGSALGSKRNAELEKGNARANSGPDTTPKGVGGPGMSYKQLMDLPPDEYAKVPVETRRALRIAEERRRGQPV